MDVRWPEPWAPIESAGIQQALEAQLRRELSKGHALEKLSVAAVAKRDDRDDVLFLLEDGRVAEVHLTWRLQPEDDTRWPRTAVYPSTAVWIEQRSRDTA